MDTVHAFRVVAHTQREMDPHEVAHLIKAAIIGDDALAPKDARYLKRKGARMTNNPAPDSVRVDVVPVIA